KRKSRICWRAIIGDKRESNYRRRRWFLKTNKAANTKSKKLSAELR
ncbi:unnamed protein product, partial [Brassica oleracea]